MPEDEHGSALLVRGAMEHAVAELAPVHDLVPAAVVQGRRRRARVRVAAAAAVACAVGAVVFGSVALPGGDGGGRTVRPAASTTPSPRTSEEPAPYRTPVHVEPTSDTEDAMADLPPAERERQEEFQQRAAVLLDGLLPDAVGLIRPVDLAVWRYQGETADGEVFSVVLSVRPSGSVPGSARHMDTCPEDPDYLKGGSCEQGTLPGGTKVAAYRLFDGSPDRTYTRVRFVYGHSDAELAVYPHLDAKASAPVSAGQMLSVVRDRRFLDLVRYADAHPMEEKQISVLGG
ncbi:hypothetical protein OG539_23030 [Actinacidiphila glaucinigra]|uniref:hypothetical protein n=1 Tax=Actinacidiphila glaucinigra TaxID=235986 RepID=UPI002DDBA667|nr:hypothetical protein [Actinacidiphila glaucinigra]WSD61001.1 hypothetical protein OIE69_19835 [Actinacidiphila glaucinigra]